MHSGVGTSVGVGPQRGPQAAASPAWSGPAAGGWLRQASPGLSALRAGFGGLGLGWNGLCRGPWKRSVGVKRTKTFLPETVCLTSLLG